MTTEATEKDRPEKPAPEPVEETGVIYSDAPDAGPPGSANAPAEDAATAPETPASAPEAAETPAESGGVEKGTAKKGA
jgi:hypothetical protein